MVEQGVVIVEEGVVVLGVLEGVVVDAAVGKVDLFERLLFEERSR